MKSRLLTTVALMGCVALAQPAFAQDSDTAQSATSGAQADASSAGGIQEIIVTAQHRSENLQRAAIAVSAVSGDALTSAGVTRPTELTAIVPSLQVVTSAGPYSLFYLRGVGNFNGNALSDSAVAFNFAGVYIGRPSSTTGFFYDLARVEVVKGPQGTLYGRNATGGAINVIPNPPRLDELSGNLTGEYGNYNAVRLDGALNVPLGTKAAVRAAGIYVRHDGYNRDGTDDQNDAGGRLSLLLDPTDTLKIVIVADYFHNGGTGPGSTPDGIGRGNRAGLFSPDGQAYYGTQPNTLLGRPFYPITYPLYQKNDFWGVSSTIDLDTPAGKITVIPAYREGKLNYQSNSPGFYINQHEKDRQTSLEARVASSDAHAFRYLFGTFLYDETNDVPSLTFIHQSNGSYQTFRANTKSMAVFGQLTYAIAPQFRLSAGGRYTTEDKKFDGSLLSVSRVCTVPTSFFPAYVPGCPDAAPIPYDPVPPAYPDFSTAATTGIITAGAPIDNTGVNVKHASFERFTYRLGADWDVTPRNLLYASYETGFKSGGFFFSADNGTFRPEGIRAFTLGSKNEFFNRRLQLNIEGFYWKYRDQQISHLGLDSAGTPIFPTENVGRATFKGVEVETKFLLTPNTLLNADVQYLDGKYDSYVYRTPNNNGGVGNGTGCPNVAAPTTVYTIDCSGQRPPNAPKWTLNVGAQQTIPLANDGKIVVSARGHYQTRTLVALDFLPVEYQKAYWLADASLAYSAPGDRYSITAFANNIFDQAVVGSSYRPAFSLFNVDSLRPPRTYGIRAGVRF